MTTRERHDQLETIAAEVRACTRCPLHQARQCAVPGEGSSSARVMFIAEGPGDRENQSGRPFVGPAGFYLNELLRGAGMARNQVFITNMIKCQAPGNRDPRPDEMEACGDYLDRQIEAINPDLIVTLGRFSTGKFLPGESISKVRGELRRRRGRNIFPIMHPAAGLHRTSNREYIQADFQRIPEILEQIRENPPQEEPEPAPRPEPPRQGTLF